jgi:ribosomal protein S18 acetylase RimI-like enzyme
MAAMPEFISLVGVHLTDIHAAFVDAFSEYEVPMDMPLECLQSMLTTRDYRPELSTACMIDGQMVGFVLVGGRIMGGALVAYDCATGVMRAFQQQKIGSQLLPVALARVQQAGTQRFVLEVLANNQAAQALYRKHGFVVTRTLHCYQTTVAVSPRTDAVPHRPEILAEIDEAAYNSFVPTWQNQLAAYQHMPEAYHVVGLLRGEMLAAYGVIHRDSGSILQMGVHPSQRTAAVFAELTQHLAVAVGTTALRIVNIEADSWLDQQFVASGWQNFVSQYEMEKRFA